MPGQPTLIRIIHRILARRWCPALCLGLVIALDGCASVTPPEGRYSLRWNYVNNSCDPNQSATFRGEDHGDLTAGRTVAPNGGRASETSERAWTDSRTNVIVTATYPGGTKSADLTSIPVSAGSTTDVYATLGGTPLFLSVLTSDPSVPIQCSWKLDGITGNASGSWQDIGGSATGTLTFNPPQEITEGSTYQVSATFSGSATAAAGWDGIKRNITVGIGDLNTLNPLLGSDGLNPHADKLVTVTGMVSESVTITAAWSPRPQSANTTTFTLQAAAGWGMGASVIRVATYSRKTVAAVR